MTTESFDDSVQSALADETKTVQMSQAKFDAIAGNIRAKATEAARERHLADLERVKEEARKEAEDIARKETEKFFNEKQTQFYKSQQEQRDAQINATLTQEFDKARNKYPDFNSTVSEYDWNDQDMQKVLQNLANIDNAGDVLYHLTKEAHIDRLAKKSPEHIQNKLKEISDSLKRPKIEPLITEDLGRLKPSHTKTNGDGDLMGKKSDYFKKMNADWSRF